MSKDDSEKDFDGFRELVLGDSALQESLRSTTDYQEFIELTVRLGKQHGYSFTAEDVAIAYGEGRRKWLERWIPQ